MAAWSASEGKRFWTILFQEHSIGVQLTDIQASGKQGRSFVISHYGEVLLNCEEGSAPGENFMSNTFIVKATTTGGHRYDAFVKIHPSNLAMREWTVAMKIQNRETAMYSSLFQYVQRLREESGCTAEQIPLNIPELYYFQSEDGDQTVAVVVMEELKYQGYVMLDKHAGSDYQHVKVALSGLAYYHALTIAFLRKNLNSDGRTVDYPSGTEFLDHPFGLDLTPIKVRYPWMEAIIGLMQLFGRDDNAKWLDELNDNLEDLMKPPIYSSLGPMACIGHGDFWNNNMFFKYDDGRPVDIKIFDFQFARLKHPMYDILYFLYTSTLPETREKHLMAFLQHYFTTAITSLEKLDVDLLQEGYTFESFYRDFQKQCIPGMITAINLLPFILEKKMVGYLDTVGQAAENEENASEDLKKGEAELKAEMEEKWQSMLTAESVFRNEDVSLRILKLVDEVKGVCLENRQ